MFASLLPTLPAPSTVIFATLKTSLKASILIAGLWLSACIYRIDIQQGNLLEEEVIDQVEVGMTRSQVQFLLGSPMVIDSFHPDRWDYTYYFRQGRSREIEQRWFVVYFQDDRVVNLDRDAELDPSS
jgi:outer membrane protein assembly factor BamE